MGENVVLLLWLDPNFCRFSKKTLFFFRFSVMFKIVLMVFVLFCHQLDNDHVKGNFILFAMMIESWWVFCRKTSQYYFDWTPTFAVLTKKHYFFFVFRSCSISFWWCLCCFAINLTIFMWKVISYSLQWRLKVGEFLSENVTKVLWLDPNFCRFSKKTLFFFRFSVMFKIVLMVFVLFCHQLDNYHAKGNFILFAMTIESWWVFCRKTSQLYFDWTPVFNVWTKITKLFLVFRPSSKSFWWCL